MADKENAACASPQRLTRAVAVAAKRKRVALSQIPEVPNALDHDDDDVKPAAKRQLQRAAEPTKKAAAKLKTKPNKPALQALRLRHVLLPALHGGGGEAAPGDGLHRGGAGRRHGQHALHPRRLARRGRRGVQARLRHALPHRLLHRPLPLLQRAQPPEAAAPRRLRHAHRIEV